MLLEVEVLVVVLLLDVYAGTEETTLLLELILRIEDVAAELILVV